MGTNRAVWSARRLGQFGSIALVAFLAGVFSQRAGLIGRLIATLTPKGSEPQPLVQPAHWRQPFVLLVAGQSNAANHGQPRARAGRGAYALASQGLYPLIDPLPGASGSGGSPWTRWAALYQARHPARDVIVAAVAQGSSAAADWVGSGVHARRIPALLPRLRRAGLQVDAIVWHQGETESWRRQADTEAYRRNLQQWVQSIRALGIQAPIFICLTSRDADGVINPGIRAAQASMWNDAQKVYAGVDTDTLDQSFRSDGVHFNQRGLARFAQLLDRAIMAANTRKAIGVDDH